MTTTPLRIGALISGGGRTVINLLDVIERGELDAEIVVVISSSHTATGVERIRARGLPVKIAAARDFQNDDERHQFITETLATTRVDLVCACGYLKWIRVDPELTNHIVNIHPALLPDFGGAGMYGDRVHAAVLASGATESGCTVHFVDDVYDHGPTIVQRRCPVLAHDTVESLAARVFEQECLAYPEAIRLLAKSATLREV